MPIPTPPNTTCDVYRSTNAPPLAPDVGQVPCYLKAIYLQGLERGEGDSNTLKFTHSLLVDQNADIRDDYNLGVIGGNQDTIYIPNQNGTPWTVIFTEWVDLGFPYQHKRIYIARKTAPYPTNNL